MIPLFVALGSAIAGGAAGAARNKSQNEQRADMINQNKRVARTSVLTGISPNLNIPSKPSLFADVVTGAGKGAMTGLTYYDKITSLFGGDTTKAAEAIKAIEPEKALGYTNYVATSAASPTSLPNMGAIGHMNPY